MIKINYGRIKKAQELMIKEGMLGIMILNHDDFIYFFNDLRIQPRAIIPASGPPVLIGFRAEEEELKEQLGDEDIKLFNTYLEMHEATRKELIPGNTVSSLDKLGKEICDRNGYSDHHIKGISHGIGLRFEENPASTIIPAHGRTKLQKDMTVTVGHTILAVPGLGGVRFEDVYRIGDAGGEILHEYPFDYVIGDS